MLLLYRQSDRKERKYCLPLSLPQTKIFIFERTIVTNIIFYAELTFRGQIQKYVFFQQQRIVPQILILLFYVKISFFVTFSPANNELARRRYPEVEEHILL